MVNTVYTSAGEAHVVDQIDGTLTATEYWIAWGSGGSSTGATASKDNTTLFVEATDVRATTALSQSSADTNQFVGTLTVETVSKTIEEAGLMSTATGGTLIIHGNHLGIGLATDDSIEYTVTLEQS